ncbi:MAG: T9SS type A sorting domain-containing protein [Bacteroidetes bacterium]|nr:T9SS type A sorting domain-containing protein [Bacteroidota bacterium]
MVGSDTLICAGDTLTVTSSGVVAPTVGNYAGVSWAISSADISGSTDPLNDPSLITTYTFNYPAPSTSLRQLVNDGAFIGGPVPYGVYYWTPVVFGNATSSAAPPQFLQDLVLDPSCTISGASFAARFAAPGDPACNVGINNTDLNALVASAFFSSTNQIKVRVNTSLRSKAEISILDITGRVVYTNNFYLSKGSNTESFTVNGLSTGTYVVKIATDNTSTSTKLVKL